MLKLAGQSASSFDHFARLAAKPGVQSTLILSKTDGSIIQSTGLQDLQSSDDVSQDLDKSASTKEGHSENSAESDIASSHSRKAQNAARAVNDFVNAAKVFAEDVSSTDEVKLLRIRTKRQEIVIVPDAKYLLVVFHDAPTST